MKNVAFGLACGLACWGLLAATAHAGDAASGNLVISQAWSRATLTRVEAALTPAPAVPAVAADDVNEPFFTHFCNSKAMANITVSPGRAGPVEITIQLEDGDERPLTTAHGVSVTLANPDKGIAPVTAIARHVGHVGDDKWVVRMNAPQSGRWSLNLGIKLSATDGVNIEAPILIR